MYSKTVMPKSGIKENTKLYKLTMSICDAIFFLVFFSWINHIQMRVLTCWHISFGHVQMWLQLRSRFSLNTFQILMLYYTHLSFLFNRRYIIPLVYWQKFKIALEGHPKSVKTKSLSHLCILFLTQWYKYKKHPFYEIKVITNHI